MSNFKDFNELSCEDVKIAGGKGASLGEMTKAGIAVPPGFVILSDVFEEFIASNDLGGQISGILTEVGQDDIEKIEVASGKIKKLILDGDFSGELAVKVDEYFKKLNSDFVAVRSSATAEDGTANAWAGQLDSFLNTTLATLHENIKRCWASLFTERAIFYRLENGLRNEKISVAVVVQKMVNSEVSGVAFSVHPVTQNKDEMIIESSYGLGEAIVSGQVTPDGFIISKRLKKIIDKNIGSKDKALHGREEGGNAWKDVSVEQRDAQSLSDEQIIALADQVIKIEKYYGFACDIEWAFKNNRFYILQSRPITTLSATNPIATDQSIVLRLKNADLQNDWEGPFSILSTDLAIGGYFSYMEKNFKTSLPFVYVVYKSGVASCYLPAVYYEKMGRYLAALALDLKKIDKWISDFMRVTNNLTKLINVSAQDFLNDLKGLREQYAEYTAYQVATKTAFNFLPIGTDQGILDKLEEARRYSEDFFKRFEVKIGEVMALIKTKVPTYSEAQLACLTFDELDSYLNKGIIPTEQVLQGRYNKKGLYWENGKLSFLEAAEVDLIDGFWLSLHSGNCILGVSAYPGIVCGSCRLIKNYKGAEIEEGEILVTGMTDPHFVPLMKKAAAIVTDGGGLLCHAAIVARELKKPCVIGTKVATKLISQGDCVEVNADEGLVKIIRE